MRTIEHLSLEKKHANAEAAHRPCKESEDKKAQRTPFSFLSPLFRLLLSRACVCTSVCTSSWPLLCLPLHCLLALSPRSQSPFLLHFSIPYIYIAALMTSGHCITVAIPLYNIPSLQLISLVLYIVVWSIRRKTVFSHLARDHLWIFFL